MTEARFLWKPNDFLKVYLINQINCQAKISKENTFKSLKKSKNVVYVLPIWRLIMRHHSAYSEFIFKN